MIKPSIRGGLFLYLGHLQNGTFRAKISAPRFVVPLVRLRSGAHFSSQTAPFSKCPNREFHVTPTRHRAIRQPADE
jgi:hypothetical protein